MTLSTYCITIYLRRLRLHGACDLVQPWEFRAGSHGRRLDCAQSGSDTPHPIEPPELAGRRGDLQALAIPFDRQLDRVAPLQTAHHFHVVLDVLHRLARDRGDSVPLLDPGGFGGAAGHDAADPHAASL